MVFFVDNFNAEYVFLNTVGMLAQLTEDPHWWLTVLLSLVLCILPVVAQKAYMVFYRPRPSQLMQEYQYKHEKVLGLMDRQSCCFAKKATRASNANGKLRPSTNGRIE